jgi:hypothetical protein
MSSQLDLCLEARDKGIVGSGSVFVLIFKCKLGHSKEAFNAQVQAQRARRLEDDSRDLQNSALVFESKWKTNPFGFI